MSSFYYDLTLQEHPHSQFCPKPVRLQVSVQLPCGVIYYSLCNRCCVDIPEALNADNMLSFSAYRYTLAKNVGFARNSCFSQTTNNFFFKIKCIFVIVCIYNYIICIHSYCALLFNITKLHSARCTLTHCSVLLNFCNPFN